MSLNRILLSGLSALAIVTGTVLGAANAQDAAPQTPPPAEAAPQPEAPAAAAPAMDETKLKSFAVAFLEVTKVTESYKPQIEAAGTTEDQQRLQQEAGEKMVEAVNNADGISVEEYNTIIQAAQTNPDLAQQINGHITEAAGAQQPAQ
ncbi:MAG: DUF4168 domain-containing protein [Neoaquamicrobium sediminum]|jgi:anion-transporting  ArsA/GET3 family ATPase|uniref:DUF4168 domain-containing protein n=2 Tax=Neoaquamicrobium sediminum TaxID=1849104 RepID=A0ABV3WSX6_9HYPH|nr:DUF4168 domain-containing protein [Mesorhizobium sp.]